MNNNTASDLEQKSKRKRWLTIVIGAFALIGIGYGIYWAVDLRYLQSTDDAYVNGNVVQITPQIAGTVTAIAADDTQYVKAGQSLVQLDQADAKVNLDQAEAQLAKTVREVRTLYATTNQLDATVAVRQSELAKANEDLTRRQRLVASGAISNEELQHAKDAVANAKAAMLAAQQALEAGKSRVDKTTLENHPDVLNASAKVREAYINFERTALPAPVSGYVAKRSVQLGQRVSPGTPLMAVVPLDQVWVDANFKEPQLANMRVGQPVNLKADLYGNKIVYHGKIIGFGAGTGSSFALLPAQNATGNWIKIIQRVPVRIALDEKEVKQHPLQIGLSMEAEIDTRERGGERLPKITQSAPYSTNVFQTVENLANERVKKIIAENGTGVSSKIAAQATRPHKGAKNQLADLSARKQIGIAKSL